MFVFQSCRALMTDYGSAVACLLPSLSLKHAGEFGNFQESERTNLKSISVRVSCL